MNTDITDNKCVIFLSLNGYKISDMQGHILFDGQTYKNPDEAVEFITKNGYDYIIA